MSSNPARNEQLRGPRKSILFPVAERQLILLYDNLELSADRACDSIPYLRRVGFEGPIIVVSGIATRMRRLELLATGAAEVLHDDDLDSVRINEVLPGIFDCIEFELTKPD